jgi:hypothetical protein
MRQGVTPARAAALAALFLAALWPAAAAYGHDPAQVAVVTPQSGTTLRTSTVTVTLRGEGGTAAATFRLLLDGREVDVNGVIGGSLFTTLRLAPGEQQQLRLRLSRHGVHELRMVPVTDADAPATEVVVRFRSAGPSTTAAALVAEVLLVAVGLGHSALARRATR